MHQAVWKSGSKWNSYVHFLEHATITFLIHKSIMKKNAVSCFCPAGQLAIFNYKNFKIGHCKQTDQPNFSYPPCVTKTLTLNVISKLINPIFHTHHAYRHSWHLPFCTAFTDLDLATRWQGQCKVKPIAFIFSHFSSDQDHWVKFYVVMK